MVQANQSLVTLRTKGDVEDIQRERRTGGARSLKKKERVGYE